MKGNWWGCGGAEDKEDFETHKQQFQSQGKQQKQNHLCTFVKEKPLEKIILWALSHIAIKCLLHKRKDISAIRKITAEPFGVQHNLKISVSNSLQINVHSNGPGISCIKI